MASGAPVTYAATAVSSSTLGGGGGEHGNIGAGGGGGGGRGRGASNGAGEAAASASPSPEVPFFDVRKRATDEWAPYTSEAVGTFFVVFTIGCAAATADDQWIPTAIGFVVMVTMYAMADVSGGHLNPALSMAFAFCGKLDWRQFFGYAIAQLLGAMLAAVGVAGVFGSSIEVRPNTENITLGFKLEALTLEGIYTATFCFVALNCIASGRNNPRSKPNQFFGMAAGFSIIAGAHAVSHASRTYFNPAVALSYGALNREYWIWAPTFAGAQFLGAMGAAVVFFIVRPEEAQALEKNSHIACVSHFLFSCCASCARRRRQEGSEDQEAQPLQVAEATVPMVTSKFASELVGTFIVVLTTVLSMAAEADHHSTNVSQLFVGNTTASNETNTNTTSTTSEDVIGNSAPWAAGCALLSMTYSLADICGGHFNPAVTLAAVITYRSRCSATDALMYWIAQGSAGLAAGFLGIALRKDVEEGNTAVELGPKSGYTWRSVATGETSFSLALALVVLCVTCVTSPRYPKATQVGTFQFGFAAGMCLAAGSFALVDITGGVLNPVTSFAMNLEYFIENPDVDRAPANLFAYVFWQMLGGLLAALLFIVIHPLEYKKDPLAPASDGWGFEW